MGKKNLLANTSENEELISLTIKKPSYRYLNLFLTMKCAPDVLVSGLFKSKAAKEITESMGALNAIQKALKPDVLGNPEINLISIGDGGTPRTAGLAAFTSKWTCWSIDPKLPKPEVKSWAKVDRLNVFSGRCEDFEVEKMQEVHPSPITILLAVHSHGNFTPFWNRVKGPKVGVEIPCCVKNNPIMPEPYLEYEDWAILSPVRTVRIWKEVDNLNGKIASMVGSS